MLTILGACRHERHARAREEQEALDVGVQHAVPIVVKPLVKGPLPDGEARVVDQRGQGIGLGTCAQVGELHQGVHALLGRLTVAHVPCANMNFCAFAPAHGGHVLKPCLAAARQQEVPTLLRQLNGGRPLQTRRTRLKSTPTDDSCFFRFELVGFAALVHREAHPTAFQGAVEHGVPLVRPQPHSLQCLVVGRNDPRIEP